MKTNAIVRICIYSLLILLLLGILLGVMGVKEYLVRSNNSEATCAPRRLNEMDMAVEYIADMRLEIYASPSHDAESVGELPAGEKVGVLKTSNVNGVSWGRIEAPVDGWIDLEYAEPVDDGKASYIDENADLTEFPATVTALEIDWAAGNIVIQSGDTEGITVAESKSSNQKPMSCKLRNGRLEIDYQEGDLKFGFGIHIDMSKDLTVTVPKDLNLREIDLDIASAEVEIRDMTVQEVDIDGASGTCTIENCDVETLNVDTASGDVKFTGSLETLDFDAASADFEGVFENNPRTMKMDSMSGDLELTLPEGCGFTASIDAMSSRFNADQEVKLVNGAYVHGDGACRIDVNGMSGDVVIHQSK